MLFTQPIFFLFFAVVFTIYWSVQNHQLRKYWLLASSLFFYGYWDVRFLGLILFIIGTTYAASRYMGRMLASGYDDLGLTLSILLPVGISFYTFQAISYTVDVYKNKLPSDIALLDYATYVAFFPQLVAGPVVRPQTFLPQIAKPRIFNWQMLRPFIFMFMIGYFKKACVADNIAGLIDPVYANYFGVVGTSHYHHGYGITFT